jgi:hypothetical protein
MGNQPKKLVPNSSTPIPGIVVPGMLFDSRSLAGLAGKNIVRQNFL